jgi:hypothetical protein
VPWLEELQHFRVVNWEVQVEETTRSEGFDPRDADLPRWLRDEPLDLRKDDQFGVDQLVDRLVGLLARAKPPFTLSLSGAWGVGKSTVADAIVARLKERKVRAVKIDAWTQDVAQLRRSVVIEVGASLKADSDEDRKALAEELDEARATRIDVQSARVEARELRPTLRQIQRSWVAYLVLAAIVALSWYKAATLDADAGLRPIFIALASILSPVLVAAVALRLVTPSTSRAPATEEFQLARKFEQVVTKRPAVFGYKGPVVVVVDNLDRLSGADAMTTLSQIRALVEIDESRCIFFIPIDRTRLSAHLGRELNDPQAAADYLEKFFNLDLQLAQPEPIDLHDWAFAEAGKLFRSVGEQDRRNLAEIAVSAAARSPRTVTRILNGTFTRHEVLGTTPTLGVRQLVLVEGLLTIAPGLADRLAAEPRAFVLARQEFAERNEETWQAEALGRYLDAREPGEPAPEAANATPGSAAPTGFDRERLRKFLAANPDIALTREQLRLALTLREDRFWKGITDADPIKDALETGDAAALTAALQGRPDNERKRIVERSVQYVVQTATYRRVAIRALDAVVPESQGDPGLAERLHRAAVGLVGEADPELLASLSRHTVQFVFGRERDASGQEKVRAALVAAIKAPTSGPVTPLVLAARCVADLLDTIDLDAARERFATASPEEQAPIFEDPPSLLLADGPVVTAMSEALGNWTPAAGGQEQAVLLAERLIALAGVGWEPQTVTTALASRLLPQVAEITNTPEALASLDAITRLFAVGKPSAEFDSFGTQLAARQAIGDQEVLRYALRWPMQPAALSSVGTEIQTWMQASAPAQIGPLLDAARDHVEEALPAYRTVLLDLWESKNDVGYARLAVGGDRARLADVGSKWAALPPPVCLEQGVPALDLVAEIGDKPMVEDLITRMVARLPTIPLADLAGAADIAAWLVKHGFERRSLAEALTARIRAAATPPDVQAVAPASIAAADHFGGRQRAALAEALAEGFVTHNVGEPDQVVWLVEHLTLETIRERLVVQLIERGLGLEPTLDAVRRAHGHFDSVQVFEALVSRAGWEAEEANAKANLDAADKWRRPAPGSTSDAPASLDTVGAKFPGAQGAGSGTAGVRYG